MKKTMGKEGEKGYSRKGKSRQQQDISYSRLTKGRQRQKGHSRNGEGGQEIGYSKIVKDRWQQETESWKKKIVKFWWWTMRKS